MAGIRACPSCAAHKGLTITKMAYAFRSLGLYAQRTVFHLRVLPRKGRFHIANVIRQFYTRRTLPLTLQGCLMRRRSERDEWSIPPCQYVRYKRRVLCDSRTYLPVT